ncbi:MAG: undecaprenyl-diphosphate phosphatase [Pirellula sp.]|jgi:undecaprenyl-diphosphatase|nr:undecaprenyl-diphosphate phosphatase [Pirellula sp.]
MTEILQALLQGIVEGLTEFLPVSSTAHIVLTQEFLGVDRGDPFWKMFAIVIQLGAILSVIVYFRTRLTDFVGTFLNELAPRKSSEGTITGEMKTSKEWYRHPLCLVLISFVVTALPCLLVDKLIGENLERLDIIAWALIIGGIAMVVVDRFFSKSSTESIENMNLRQAIAIGLFQILAAAFPGTSRSMATIAGGQIFGLSRSAALEFSFFLAIPVMIAAASYKLLKHLLDEPLPTDTQWLSLAVGFVTSFLVAYLVIAWFMKWVRSRGFVPFAVYRVIAGTILLWWISRA